MSDPTQQQNLDLMEIKDLRVYFHLSEGIVRAVDGVNFKLKRGRTLGVVGESGCGKSVTARALLRIESPGKIISGKITFHSSLQQGQSEAIELTSLDLNEPKIREIRGKEIGMIFQEPMTSFGPMHTIGNQIEEAVLLHKTKDKKEARSLALQALESVGMPRPQVVLDQFPHQLSGGMRQRAMIAMALSCGPSLLIADEPTTALDVTTEAQIIDLLKERQESLGLAMMYITHNLGVIAQIAQDVIVMYLGKIVEQASVEDLFYNAKHPYTEALMKSIPRVDQDPTGPLASIEGMLPDPYTHLSGCPFHPRCSRFIPGLCDIKEPTIVQVSPGHFVSCYLYHQKAQP
jgi:oligopeptide/dipeptide ABC transporter ATP-binding protein